MASLVDEQKLDLRVWVDSKKYKGRTKQGFRFYLVGATWDRFKELVNNIDAIRKTAAVHKERTGNGNLHGKPNFEVLFKSLGIREQYVLHERYLAPRSATLKTIAKHYEISRERVRQLENKGLTYLKKHGLDKAFHDELRNAGFPKIMRLERLSIISRSLGIVPHNPRGLLKMIGKIVDIRFDSLGGDYVYPTYEGRPRISQIDIDLWKMEPQLPRVQFKEYLRKQGFGFLTPDELGIVYGHFSRQHQRKVLLYNLVVASLRAIGHPAHYSDIAEKVRSLSEGRHSTCAHSSVHSALTTYKDKFVCVGLKGVHGLREWGISEPAQPLEDQVLHILECAGRSFSKTEIGTELSKERPYFSAASLAFVLGTSVRIRKDEGGLFHIATAEEAQEKGRERKDRSKTAEAIREVFKDWSPPGQQDGAE